MDYEQNEEGVYRAQHNLNYGPCPYCGTHGTWGPVEADIDPHSGSEFIYLECEFCGALGSVTVGKIEQ